MMDGGWSGEFELLVGSVMQVQLTQRKCKKKKKSCYTTVLYRPAIYLIKKKKENPGVDQFRLGPFTTVLPYQHFYQNT